MEWWTYLTIILAVLTVFFLSGLPIAFCFTLFNFIAVYFWMGGVDGFALLTVSAFSSIVSFPLVAVPLFILMGELLVPFRRRRHRARCGDQVGGGAARQSCPGVGRGRHAVRYDERLGGIGRGRSRLHPGTGNAPPRLQQGDVARADPRQRLPRHDHPAERARRAAGLARADTRRRPADLGHRPGPAARRLVCGLYHRARAAQSSARPRDGRPVLFVAGAHPRGNFDQPRPHCHPHGMGGHAVRNRHAVGGRRHRGDRRPRCHGHLSPRALGGDPRLAARHGQDHRHDFSDHHQRLGLQPDPRFHRNDGQDRELCLRNRASRR